VYREAKRLRFYLAYDRNPETGTGRMGVVVPHGVLFRGSSEGKIRQKLIDENLLDAVIGHRKNCSTVRGFRAILISKSRKLMTRCCLSMPAVIKGKTEFLSKKTLRKSSNTVMAITSRNTPISPA
jgi:hypothetical protein